MTAVTHPYTERQKREQELRENLDRITDLMHMATQRKDRRGVASLASRRDKIQAQIDNLAKAR